jgi:CO/xanthine dehydrogenase FAD-binding subunit
VAGVHGVPYRNSALEQSLVGCRLTSAECEEAAQAIARDLHPQADLHASSEYRKELAGLLVARALDEAATKARASQDGAR